MINYKRAGVDIDKANLLLKKIKNLVPEIGGFSGLVPVDRKYKSPVLVTSCDGVGTKLKIATLLNRHNTIGIDLVAMVVNDIITTGARPLFLLDYFACGKLDVKVAEEVIKGIVKGCRIAGCKLHGGETAEMPGMYRIREYDLAGFGVGMIEKERIIDTSNIKAGDVLVGLPSSGIHSNGFSLVRKIFSKKELKKMGDELLTPTRIYVREVLSVISYLPTAISGIAHITGGGMIDNLYRICLLYTSPSPRDLSTSRMPSSA